MSGNIKNNISIMSGCEDMIKSLCWWPFWILILVSKCSRMRTPHPLDVIIYMLEMNNQQGKKLYQAKRGYPHRLLEVSPWQVLSISHCGNFPWHRPDRRDQRLLVSLLKDTSKST